MVSKTLPTPLRTSIEEKAPISQIAQLKEIQSKLNSFLNNEQSSLAEAKEFFPLNFETVLLTVSEENRYDINNAIDFSTYHQQLFETLSLVAQGVQKYDLSASLFQSKKSKVLDYINLHMARYLSPENEKNFSFLTLQSSLQDMFEAYQNDKNYTKLTQDFIENQRKQPIENLKDFLLEEQLFKKIPQILNFFSVSPSDYFEALSSLYQPLSLLGAKAKEELTHTTFSLSKNSLSFSQRVQLVQSFDSEAQQNQYLFMYIWKELQEHISTQSTPEQLDNIKQKHGSLDGFLKEKLGIDYSFSAGLKNYFQATTSKTERHLSFPTKIYNDLVDFLAHLQTHKFLTLEETQSSKELLNVNDCNQENKNSAVLPLWKKYPTILRNCVFTQKELQMILFQHIDTEEGPLWNLGRYNLKPTFKNQYEKSDTLPMVDLLISSQGISSQGTGAIIYLFIRHYDSLNLKDKKSLAEAIQGNNNKFGGYLSFDDKNIETYGNTYTTKAQKEKIELLFPNENNFVFNFTQKMAQSMVLPYCVKENSNQLRNHLVQNIMKVPSILNEFDYGIALHSLNEINKEVKKIEDFTFFNVAKKEPQQKQNIFETVLTSLLGADSAFNMLVKYNVSKTRLKHICEHLSNVFGKHLDNFLFEEPIQGLYSVGDVFKRLGIPTKDFLTSSEIADRYFKENPHSTLRPKNKKFLGLFNTQTPIDYAALAHLVNPQISKYGFKSGIFYLECVSAPSKENTSRVSASSVEGLFHTLSQTMERTQTSIHSEEFGAIELDIKLAVQKSSLVFIELLQFCKAAEEFLPLTQKIEAKQLFGHFEESVEKYQNVVKKINLLTKNSAEDGFLKNMLHKNDANLDNSLLKANTQILNHLKILNENAQSLKQSMEVSITQTDLKELMVQGQFLENKFGKAQNTPAVETDPIEIQEEFKPSDTVIPLKSMSARKGL